MFSPRTTVTSVVTGVCIAAAACSGSSGETSGTASYVATQSTLPSAEAWIDTLPLLFDDTLAPEPMPSDPGSVAPGTYRIAELGVRSSYRVVDQLNRPVAITIPAGWYLSDKHSLRVSPGTYMWFTQTVQVASDSCADLDRVKSLPSGSAAEVIASLPAQEGTETTTPKVIDVNGVSVTEIDVSTTLDPRQCPSGVVVLTTTGVAARMFEVGETCTLFVFDVDGRPASITVVGRPMDDSTRADVEQMIRSLRIA